MMTLSHAISDTWFLELGATIATCIMVALSVVNFDYFFTSC